MFWTDAWSVCTFLSFSPEVDCCVNEEHCIDSPSIHVNSTKNVALVRPWPMLRRHANGRWTFSSQFLGVRDQWERDIWWQAHSRMTSEIRCADCFRRMWESDDWAIAHRPSSWSRLSRARSRARGLRVTRACRPRRPGRHRRRVGCLACREWWQPRMHHPSLDCCGQIPSLKYLNAKITKWKMAALQRLAIGDGGRYHGPGGAFRYLFLS